MHVVARRWILPVAVSLIAAFSLISLLHFSILSLSDLVVAGTLVAGAAIHNIDVGRATEKFKARGAAAAGDYKVGVQGAGAIWLSNTEAANDAWKQGVQQASTQDRFNKGVQKAGSEKFTRKAVSVGADRFGPGIAAAGPDYAKGVQPVFQALQGFDPGPRGPKGSLQNQQRAAAVATKLRALKTGA